MIGSPGSSSHHEDAVPRRVPPATGDLPPRLARLACLRTAWLCDSEYLWAHLREQDRAYNIGDRELHEVHWEYQPWLQSVAAVVRARVR